MFPSILSIEEATLGWKVHIGIKYTYEEYGEDLANDGAIDSSSYTVGRRWFIIIIIMSITGTNDAMTPACGVVPWP